MASSRAVGHTGGTLDKLESIPGFRTDLSLEEIQAQLTKCGLCYMSKAPEASSLDAKLYALREVAPP
jgi:thymidine phosphorylase